MVPHVPPQTGSQYRHAGAEVWYSSRVYNGKYKICENLPGLSENKDCSKSLWVKIGVKAHSFYLGKEVSGQCTLKQASNTRI